MSTAARPPINKDEALIFVLLLGEASAVFGGPPFFHEAEPTPANVGRIRRGELAASIIVIGTGWAVSSRSSGNAALIAAVLISAAFVASYEYEIAHRTPDDKAAKAAGGEPPWKL